MLFLLACCIGKYGLDDRKSLFFRLAGCKGIAVSGLALACKRTHQILDCLAVF